MENVHQAANIPHLNQNQNLAKVKLQILNTLNPTIIVLEIIKLYFLTQQTRLKEMEDNIATLLTTNQEMS